MEKVKDLTFGEVKHPTSDASLWLKFKAGDKVSLGIIFNLYYDALFIYGLKISPNEEVVKDAIQDVFLKLWNSRETLSNLDAIKPYLLKCLRRYIVDESHTLNRYSAYEDMPKQEYALTLSPEQSLINQYNLEITALKLENALKQLTKRQREVVFLRFNQGLDYEKIAEITDINLQSVRNLICQAIKVLKGLLAIFIIHCIFS